MTFNFADHFGASFLFWRSVWAFDFDSILALYFGIRFWRQFWLSVLELDFGARFWHLILALNFGDLFWSLILVLKFGVGFWRLILMLSFGA